VPGVRDQKVHTLERQLRQLPPGGLVILKGNLAPDGCVVKVAGHSMMQFRGPAKVYDREEDGDQKKLRLMY
jgi:dihydroxyacid dehydratase/phosphogluconate dehydratase